MTLNLSLYAECQIDYKQEFYIIFLYANIYMCVCACNTHVCVCIESSVNVQKLFLKLNHDKNCHLYECDRLDFLITKKKKLHFQKPVIKGA